MAANLTPLPPTDWNAVWTAVTAISTAVGAIATCFAAVAIFIARKQLRFEAWRKAQEIWTDRDLTEERTKLFKRLDAPDAEWEDQEKEEALNVCRKMDDLATLLPFLSTSQV